MVLCHGRRGCPLLVFSGRIIEEVLGPWKWGVPDKDKKKIKDHLAALQILKERGMKGSGIISAYHMRRVAPLMAHVLPLHLMAPGASLEGMVLVKEVLPLLKWHSASRRRWSLRRTPLVPPLTMCIRCQGIPQCGWN